MVFVNKDKYYIFNRICNLFWSIQKNRNVFGLKKKVIRLMDVFFEYKKSCGFVKIWISEWKIDYMRICLSQLEIIIYFNMLDGIYI